jgi:hypothetical protein
MRLGLFESAWLGSQAFEGAAAFNANIGAWNTASMTTMASVCPHCHRQPQLCRISMVERQHIAPHTLGPVDGARTIH